jgi:hypothetical protein
MTTASTKRPQAHRPGAGPDIYRAFFVASNGRVLGMVPLDASCEDEARTLARRLAADDIVELWVGLRAVARFERCKCVEPS